MFETRKDRNLTKKRKSEGISMQNDLCDERLSIAKIKIMNATVMKKNNGIFNGNTRVKILMEFLMETPCKIFNGNAVTFFTSTFFVRISKFLKPI